MAMSSFPDGLVVWARLPPYPWWPGVIVNRKDGEAKLDAEYSLPVSTRHNRVVLFFNDGSKLDVVQVRNLAEFTGSMRRLQSAPLDHYDIIVDACAEAQIYIEEKGLPEQKELLQNNGIKNEKSGRESDSRRSLKTLHTKSSNLDELHEIDDVTVGNSPRFQPSSSRKRRSSTTPNRKVEYVKSRGSNPSPHKKRAKTVSHPVSTESPCEKGSSDCVNVTISGNLCSAVVQGAESYIKDMIEIGRMRDDIQAELDNDSHQALLKCIRVLQGKKFMMDDLLEYGIGKTLVRKLYQLRSYAPEAAEELSDVLKKWRVRANALVQSLQPPTADDMPLHADKQPKCNNEQEHENENAENATNSAPNRAAVAEDTSFISIDKIVALKNPQVSHLLKLHTPVSSTNIAADSDLDTSAVVAKQVCNTIDEYATEYIKGAVQTTQKREQLQSGLERLSRSRADLQKNIKALYSENLSLALLVSEIGKKLVHTVEKLRVHSDELADELFEVVKNWRALANQAMLILNTSNENGSTPNIKQKQDLSSFEEEEIIDKDEDEVGE